MSGRPLCILDGGGSLDVEKIIAILLTGEKREESFSEGMLGWT